MTLKHKLTKKMHKKEIIPACCVCNRVRIENVWIKNHLKEHIKNYRNYSHTYCDVCLDVVMEYNGVMIK